MKQQTGFSYQLLFPNISQKGHQKRKKTLVGNALSVFPTEVADSLDTKDTFYFKGKQIILNVTEQ